MKKIGILALFLLLLVTIHPVYCIDNNYLRIKYGSDSSDLSYRNSYFAYGLHYHITENVIFNLNLKKLPDENGFYPIGYFAPAEWGIYERGSYSLYIKNIFGFKKIIFGNYILHFGQGLLGGSGYPVYINNPYYDLAKFNDNIAVARTYSKSGVFEGLVAEFSNDRIKIRPFISWNSFDCSTGESEYYKYNDNDYDGIPNKEDDNDFTGIGEGFLQNYSCKYSLEKAINDEETYSNSKYRERRNKLKEYILGINSSYNISRFKGGITFLYSRFNRMIDPYYNFDPDSGSKTANYFRGKDYVAAEAYFKFNGNIQFFTDIVGSYYRSLSYYKEFSGKYIKGLGVSSGIRTKIDDVSALVWVAYIPANVVNPHAVEYPWGKRNFMSAVANMDISSELSNFNHWIEGSKELFNVDNPGSGEEVDFSYNYEFFYDVFRNTGFELKQKYETIDNYYYFPGKRCYKIITKVNVKQELSENIRLTDLFEWRHGKVIDSFPVDGLGIGGRINIYKNNNQFKGMIFGYLTDGSVLSSLYPYEPSVYRWSFMPASLSGKGILISASYVRDFADYFTVGFKARFNVNATNISESSLKFYIETEMRF